MTSMALFWCLYWLTLNIFHALLRCFYCWFGSEHKEACSSSTYLKKIFGITFILLWAKTLRNRIKPLQKIVDKTSNLKYFPKMIFFFSKITTTKLINLPYFKDLVFSTIGDSTTLRWAPVPTTPRTNSLFLLFRSSFSLDN